MTAEQFISIIRNRLGKRKFHEEVIRYNIGRAYSIFMVGQDDLTAYRKDYPDIEVHYNIDNDRYYSLLPEMPLNIEDAVRITLRKGEDFVFEPMVDGQAEIFSDLEVAKVSKNIGYKLKTDKVWYEWMTAEISKVNMHIVIPFEAYGYTEDIYLPAGSDELIIETVTNYLLGKQPELNINDGSEITA